MVSTPSSARAGPGSRPESASGWRWPGPSFATPPSCCSTSRRPTSTAETEAEVLDAVAPAGRGPHRRDGRPPPGPAGPGRSGGRPVPGRGGRRDRRALVTVRRGQAPRRRPSGSPDSAPARRPSAGLGLARLAGGAAQLTTLLGAGTAGCGIALLATSAWLISRAAQHPSVVALGVAIVGVQFFAVSRASVPLRRTAGRPRRGASGPGRSAGPGLRAPGSAGAHGPARLPAVATCWPAWSRTSTPCRTSCSG